MTDYLKAAEAQKITFVEAYIQVQNAIVRQTAISHPTPDDFKNFEFLQKQLKNISKAITEESIKENGYERNPQTYMWELRSPAQNQNNAGNFPAEKIVKGI